ncbi:MAG TPA: prephenate dehydrogenase [Mycobacteriales bacterium]|nr:prephenate dehydrogenase [Mycobacteriales bacterium]
MPADVLVVGTGLIGTSLGLALHGRADVLLTDVQPAALATAVARGAGRVWDGAEPAAVAVVCTPPAVVAAQLLRVAASVRTATHVCSVQAPVQAALEAAGCDPAVVCGSHPMAGRERGGPESALASLFAGRPWVLCPSPRTSGQALADVRALVELTGAVPVELAPERHDAAVALVSHLPQVAASALAAQLLRGTPDAAALAGPGLQDSTRIAASDPALWRDVLALNAGDVAPLVRALAEDLLAVAAALDAGLVEPVVGLLGRGAQGRSLVPVKRGERDAAFTAVAVSVPDTPGRLAALFIAAGEAGVNVEDVRVDHVPGSPRGVIELAVRAPARETLEGALRAAGWDVVGS